MLDSISSSQHFSLSIITVAVRHDSAFPDPSQSCLAMRLNMWSSRCLASLLQRCGTALFLGGNPLRLGMLAMACAVPPCLSSLTDQVPSAGPCPTTSVSSWSYTRLMLSWRPGRGLQAAQRDFTVWRSLAACQLRPPSLPSSPHACRRSLCFPPPKCHGHGACPQNASTGTTQLHPLSDHMSPAAGRPPMWQPTLRMAMSHSQCS